MILRTIPLSILLTTSLFAQGELALNNLDINELGQMSLEELMNVTIVSSTGKDTKVSDAPSVASVITAQQIESSSARTLSEVMQMVAGVHVYYPLGTARQESYDIRGISTSANNQILTLINGVSIKKYELGHTMLFFEFPASLIQRVEVIRGPGSALYGADAFSGVINIITKDAQYLSKHSQAGVRYGSFKTGEVYGNYGEAYENGIELGLNLSYMGSQGDKNRIANADTQTALDGLFGTSASLAPGTYPTDYKVFNMSLNLNYENFSMNLWGYSQDNGLISGGTNTLDPEGYTKGSYLVSDLNYKLDIANGIVWENKLILSYNSMTFKSSLFPAGTKLPINSDGNIDFTSANEVIFTDGYNALNESVEKMAGFESTFTLSKFDAHNIRASVGYHYRDLDYTTKVNFGTGVLDGTEGSVDGTLTDLTHTPYTSLPSSSRKLFFLSLQDIYTMSKTWELTAGLRYDYYSDIGDTINPRIGLVNHTTERITTKLLYGRAFRAPSAGELGFQNNPALLGNANLKPEIIDMLELGMSYSASKNLMLSANIYVYQVDDLITQSGTTREYENIGHQDGTGIELESSYQVRPDLLLKADYAYRWTKNKDTNQVVAGVPKHIGHARLDYSFMKDWHINSDLMFAADRARLESNPNPQIDDYAVVNANIGYRAYEGLEFTLAVRNLFDTIYYDPTPIDAEDFPSAGISYFAELKYRF